MPLAVFITVAALPLLAQQPPTEPFSPDAIRFFENEVRPVLLNNCASCHNAKLLTSGLSVESREDIVKGGNRGEAVSPGLPEESRLVHAVRQQGPLKMPPGGKLAPQEISALARWIEMRLPWPSQSALAPSAGQASSHWSFQPVERPTAPQVSDAAWPRNPIDRFILARLEPERPAALARSRESHTHPPRLYRPDRPAAHPRGGRRIIEDTSPNAYEKVVGRLLESPHYGERWGRHWLDLARYADSNGYNADGERKIWMYREWLIRALNRDLPFDQFVIEQIAGTCCRTPPKIKSSRPDSTAIRC